MRISRVDACGQMAVLHENAADGGVYLTRHGGGAASIDPGPDGSTSGLRLRAYPDPFHHATEIRVIVSDGGTIAGPEVGVFDIRGSLMTSLAGRRLSACEHRFVWQGVDSRGTRVAPGVYFICVSSGGCRESRAVVVLR